MNTYTPNQFLLKDFVKDTEQFHLSRVNISGLGDLSFHTHDYAELFWVESGSGIHHINGRTVALKPYDVVMIRPTDLHTFSSPKGDLTIVNVAFYTSTLDYYKSRYFPDSNSYFWTDKELPYHCNLRQDCISRFTARVESIMKKKHSFLQLDSLMLHIFRTFLNEQQHVTENSQMPPWLINAIEQFKRPENFIRGTESFIELCNRSQDYIGRALKKSLHKTLTSYINEVRMEYAVTQLTMTNMPIKEISSRCGYESLAHVYFIFRKTYHVSPHQYRTHNQKIV